MIFGAEKERVLAIGVEGDGELAAVVKAEDGELTAAVKVEADMVDRAGALVFDKTADKFGLAGAMESFVVWVMEALTPGRSKELSKKN